MCFGATVLMWACRKTTPINIWVFLSSYPGTNIPPADLSAVSKRCSVIHWHVWSVDDRSRGCWAADSFVATSDSTLSTDLSHLLPHGPHCWAEFSFFMYFRQSIDGRAKGKWAIYCSNNSLSIMHDGTKTESVLLGVFRIMLLDNIM